MENLRLYPATFRQATKWALYAAIAMPVVYFGTQLVAAPYYPGYSFSRDTASMLGTTDSQHPWIFNLGAVLTGVAGLAGALGLFQALKTKTWTALAALVALSVVANGVLSLKAGMFPMPDPRHASWQFLMPVILIAPLLLLIALWWQGATLRTYLLCNIVALGLILPMMMHRVAPIFAEGTMRRLFALLVFVPIGVAGYALVQSSD
ncbi:MAG TPA: DUF998 domain-containing protein [Acidisarcina sp.]|nr:DUF998 domain-containing protein [Acidisarcina sp.]